MTEDEAIAKLQAIHDKYDADPEGLHAEEDELLITALRACGWTRLAHAHQTADVTRWFA